MIAEIIKEYIANSEFNVLSEKEALEKEFTGLRLFDEPLIGFASADDDLFDEYRDNQEITQGRFMHPKQWLPEAQTVISIFFPFSKRVKISNMIDALEPSDEWRYARYLGQQHLNELTDYLRDKIVEAGYKCVAPAFDNRFRVSYIKNEKINEDYGSNWSERHVAYAAGLGTFGLSKGLITKCGVAGRFLSVITDMEHEPTHREYSGVYEYCSMCGACVRNCPAGAISVENGKQHVPCYLYIKQIRAKFVTRSGCGKCQVGVPCMDKAPI